MTASTLTPTLHQIEVPSGKLVLDPNNPRLITREEDKHDPADATDAIIVERTRKKLSENHFHVQALENSILTNGWCPVDLIFVQKLPDGENYLVLEGNRRVTAVRKILVGKLGTGELREELASLEVMEIVGDESPEDSRKKIAYLLGVRHLGSLIPWTPFAQARNIFLRYIELSGRPADRFAWDETVARKVAESLCISVKDVQERIRVYRAMHQLEHWPTVKESNGSMRDRYYSVCRAVLMNPKPALKEYIQQDPVTFLLDDTAMEKMDAVCHFSRPLRQEAPIVNPQEWSKLEKILADEDEQKRKENLKRVVEGKERPSDVWAERSAELQVLQWDRWLAKVAAVLKTVTIGDLGDDSEPREDAAVTRRLAELVEQLDARDLNDVGPNHV